MAQHHLNRAQIGAVLEQMRGKRVSQHVRAQRARQAGLPAVSLENLPEADARQAAPRFALTNSQGELRLPSSAGRAAAMYFVSHSEA